MTHPKKNEIALGARVILVEAQDIVGVVTAWTQYRDGSERFDVVYWHGGERKTVTCDYWELELA